MIPISRPLLDDAVEREVLEVIRSGQLAQGPKVAELESVFRVVTNCDHAVAVSSGTVALELALALLDLHPGDEVITSAFTFGATLSSIIHSGASAVLVDVDDDGLIDIQAASDQITGKTRALIPVHLYGLPVDYSRLTTDRAITVVEDAAQAIGAAVAGSPVGSQAIGCFSLYATKNITTGEGGVLTTNDAALAAKARTIRNQGMASPYHYVSPGHNYRMTDLQAAVGLPQLRHLDSINQARADNAKRLREGLAGLPGLVLPMERDGRKHVWHQFTVRVTASAILSRDELAASLRDRGVATGIYYPKVLVDYPCFAEHARVRWGPLPRARQLAGEVLSLPVHPGLKAADIDHIVRHVRNALSA